MRCAAASSICSRPAWTSRCGSISSATRWKSIRSFDPETQRTTADLRALDLVPMAEFQLTTDTIRLFRTGYVAAFGAAAPDDVLYEAVSEGRRHAGMEHWLPLFHQQHGNAVRLSRRQAPSRSSRSPKKPRTSGWPRSPTTTRRARMRSTSPAAARPTSRCRRTGSISPKPNGASAWTNSALARLTPFSGTRTARQTSIDVGAHAGHNFAAERATPDANVFEAVTKHVDALQAAGKRAMIALWSEGSRERMAHVLAEHGLVNLTPVASWPQALALPRHEIALAVLGIEVGLRDRRRRGHHRSKTFWASGWCARAGSRSARKISSPR